MSLFPLISPTMCLFYIKDSEIYFVCYHFNFIFLNRVCAVTAVMEKTRDQGSFGTFNWKFTKLLIFF